MEPGYVVFSTQYGFKYFFRATFIPFWNRAVILLTATILKICFTVPTTFLTDLGFLLLLGPIKNCQKSLRVFFHSR